MPSAFDLFGPFENSLRTYHKPQWRTRPCPHGIHVPENCTCDPNHECKRPHCANDMPLDPLCRLTIGTPFGPMTSITDTPAHKCHSNGCSPSPPTTPTKPMSAFSTTVVDRLYSTRTQASTAKMKPGRGEDPAEESTGGGGKPGTRLISQLIGDQAVGNHDRTRRDGVSPSPTRRAQSIGVRRAPTSTTTTTPPDPGYPTRRSQSSHAAVKTVVRSGSKRVRGSESDASSSEMSSSPETSPGSTPATTPAATPRKFLSPKNSGNQLLPIKNCTSKKSAKSPYARPSAVFCNNGGRGKIKPTPLNKSASDGVERQRNKAGLKPFKNKDMTLLRTGEKKVLCEDVINEQLRNKLSRVSSDSRVDELLAQAYMALESLTPEHSGGGGPVVLPQERQHHHQTGTAAPGSPPPPDVLRRMAIAHARKENGKSYKDLTQILQEKIEELDDAMVSVALLSVQQVVAASLSHSSHTPSSWVMDAVDIDDG